HLHAGEGFEQRRHLRCDFGDVAGQLVRAGGIAVAGGDDGDLVHFAEWLGEGTHDVGHAGDELVEDGGLVIFLIGFGLDVHRLGFSFTLLEDDLGFGFALRAGGRGAAFGFLDQALPFGFGEGLDALPLDFGGLEHRGNQLAFAARNFGFLHLYLRFAFDLLDADGFHDHLLLLDVGFDFVGFVGLRLRALGGFEVLGFLNVEVAFRFRLLGQRGGFGGY